MALTTVSYVISKIYSGIRRYRARFCSNRFLGGRWNGEWPVATVVLSLTNDLIWWVPFALYLHDAWPFYKRDILRSEV